MRIFKGILEDFLYIPKLSSITYIHFGIIFFDNFFMKSSSVPVFLFFSQIKYPGIFHHVE